MSKYQKLHLQLKEDLRTTLNARKHSPSPRQFKALTKRKSRIEHLLEKIGKR